ncbi:MAG: insulinase family protein, partial [Flavobacteriales bacterium]|nr:insulinase family protein [Flavobacteriales bacterium]
MKRILIAASLCVSILGANAQSKIEFEQYKLKNGMNVILHEDHSTPIVAVTILYHVGSKNEVKTRTGFAHFFEHLMFEGSENIGRGEYMKTVSSNGGILNANTSFDRTFYFEILPSNQLELGLWMESERLLHLKVDSIGVQTQREVVKEEYRQSDNQPYGSFLREMFSRAFEKHSYNWVPIGSLDHLNEATIEEFVEFYKTYYVPNNATLSIAGDFDKKQLKKWINTYFSTIPKGTKKMLRPTIKEPIKNKEVRDTVFDNIQLPAVMMGFHTPEQGTPDAYAVDMLAQVLSQGNSSRLQKSIVDEQEKALFVGAFPFPSEDPGLSLMFGIPNVGVELLDLEAAIDLEVEKLQNELISERDYQKLQNQFESQFVNSNSSVAGIASSLATYYLLYDNVNLINEQIDIYRSISREEIQSVAQK